MLGLYPWLIEAGETGCGPVFVGFYADTFVDRSGNLTLEEIESPAYATSFQPNRKKHFGFGLSNSANWIRFRLDQIIPDGCPPADKPELSFNYACFGDIRVYLPGDQTSASERVMLKGGIAHGPDRDDTGFLYPRFSLPADTAHDRDIYIRIQGPFTSNFQLLLCEADAFEPAKLRIVLFLSFVFGVIGAMLLYNLVLFFALRDRVYLLYGVYLFFILLYQSVLSGIVKIISLPAGDFLSTHVVLLCFLAMAANLAFAWRFLDVPQAAAAMKKFFRIAWLFILVGAVFALAAKTYQANVIAYAAGMVLPFMLLATVYVSYRNGHWVSLYYLLAVGMLLFSVVIFALRGLGLIEHSLATSYGVLSSAAIEAVLYSFALADRVRRLQQQQRSLQEREKELSQISITDEMTGLFNRRHYDHALRGAIRFSRESGHPLTLLFLDIDHFKTVNDLHGHPKGDDVLKALSAIMKQNLRSSDYPCRIGGEEFAVIMLNTDLSGSARVAERIREEFAQKIFDSPAGAFSSSISIGLVAFRDTETVHELITRADQALYRAKTEGRNRTVVG